MIQTPPNKGGMSESKRIKTDQKQERYLSNPKTRARTHSFSLFVVAMAMDTGMLPKCTSYAGGKELDAEWIQEKKIDKYEVFKHNHRIKWNVDLAARHGHLELLKLIKCQTGEKRTGCSVWAMDLASMHGHLECIKWLHTNVNSGCTYSAMDWASRYGHLAVVEFLHKQREEGCSHHALEGALLGGHMDVVQFLHSRGLSRDKPSDSSIEQLIQTGKPEALKWVLDHYPQVLAKPDYYGRLNVVILGSLQIGKNLETLEWLLDNTPYLVSPSSYKAAAEAGALECVKYLDRHPHVCSAAKYMANRQPSTKDLVVVGCKSGNLEMVEWLLDQKTPTPLGREIRFMRAAAVSNNRKLMGFLSRTYPPASHCVRGAICVAAGSGHLEALEWLAATYPEGCSHTGDCLGSSTPEILASPLIKAIEGGHLEVVEFLAKDQHEWPSIPVQSILMKGQPNWELIRFIHWHGGSLSQHHLERLRTIAILQGNIGVTRFLFDSYPFLHDCGQVPWSRMMGLAASHGHLQMLEWLEHRSHQAGGSWSASLAQNILTHIRSEGVDINPLDKICRNGHLHILEWLRKKQGLINIPLSKDVWEKNCWVPASGAGHLHVIRFLQKYGEPSGCTAHALDAAAAEGHLSTVKWLHYHRGESCRGGQAKMQALLNGHLNVAKWLHSNRLEPLCDNIFFSPKFVTRQAVLDGHLDAARWTLGHLAGLSPAAAVEELVQRYVMEYDEDRKQNDAHESMLEDLPYEPYHDLDGELIVPERPQTPDSP